MKYSCLFVTFLSRNDNVIPFLSFIRKLISSSSVFMIVCHFNNMTDITLQLYRGIISFFFFFSHFNFFSRYLYSENIYIWGTHKFSSNLYDSSGEKKVDTDLIVILAGTNMDASSEYIMSWDKVDKTFRDESATKLSIFHYFNHFRFICI